MVSTFLDVAIKIQLIRNGIVVTIDIGLRPNRSINGPIMREPIGSDIVTNDAEMFDFLQKSFCGFDNDIIPIHDAWSRVT